MSKLSPAVETLGIHARRSLAALVAAAAIPVATSWLAFCAPVSAAEPPQITIRSEDSGGLDISFELGSFELEPVIAGDRFEHRVLLPGVPFANPDGGAGLPCVSAHIALPSMARATATITRATTSTHRDTHLADHPSSVRNDRIRPESPIALREGSRIRGLDLITLAITPFQYNPATRELIAYEELEIRIDFHGGTGRFGEDRLRNRYWEELLRDHVLNYASLPAIDFDGPRDRQDGYEYVIITPDQPDFVAWADSLATWRRLQGVSAATFTTTDIGGNTAAVIEAWLDQAYHTWEIPPVAFLILGDHPQSGEGKSKTPGIPAPVWNGYCISDNVYADVDGDDLPDMIPSRIAAQHAAQLEAMIGKLLSYERRPYTNPDFYSHPVLSSCWHTTGSFVLCTEAIYGFQANVLGKHPVREYAIASGYPGESWNVGSCLEGWVTYFGPDGLGYIPATPEYLNDWGGNATRINADINTGAYFVLHRDHGSEVGWGVPSYTITDLGGLTNDKYPFVFSPDCLTGDYGRASPSFAEFFHRMDHGALGVIAPVEITYGCVTEIFTWGVFDGLWPEFIPDMPSAGGRLTGVTDLRTAFAHASAKYFLDGLVMPDIPPAHKAMTYHIFHHHGDAFTTIYSEVPEELAVFHDPYCPANASVFTVQADEDALIALTVGGEIIGVATATGLPLEIPIIPQTGPGDLRVTVTKANHYRYDRSIPILSQEGLGQERDAENGAPALRLELASPLALPARIAYWIPRLPGGAPVLLDIYDPAGRRVRRLVDESQSGGRYIVTWDGTDQSGSLLPGGVFFCQLRWNGEKLAERFLLVR